MNVSVERLRVWLLVGAGLLVVVVAGFLGYAHYRAHRFLTNLPGKLGVDIRRETNGYTYSQSSEGKTIYTIHAAKAVERSDGKTTLHDVGIVLYGRKQDRADRIYGNEFEYDQANGVVRAVGEVHIDLQAPEAADAKAKMDYAAGKDLHGRTSGSGKGTASVGENKDARLIHVTTSGLVFLQKLGVAATDKDIEFESGGLTGHAVGADYTSDTGVVVLHSAVKVNGLQHDRPVVLTASHAVLDRPDQTMELSQAKYVEVGGKTVGAEGQTAQAQHVVVHLRKDGSAERVLADGDVTLTNGTGGSVVAPRGEMTLNAQNQPQSAVMMGGVRYAADDPLRQAKGEAAEGHAAFDKKGRPEHVVMSGAVSLREHVRTSSAEPWSERELNASAVELALATDSAGKTLLKDAKATGKARLKQLKVSAKSGTASSELAGDVLTAHFVRVEGADHLAEVHGEGNTSLRKVAPNGVVNTSAADSMVAHFRPAKAGAHTGSGAKTTSSDETGADDIADATERGHVVLTKLPAKKPGDMTPPAEERVTAERAVYIHEAGSGDLDRTTLTGNVQVGDGTNTLWADQVTEQQNGDATAEGSVKASYGQAESVDGPVHVMAARADLKHDSEVATFHGVPGKPARLWQGTSQVDAPVVEFDQKQKRLLAHGEGQGTPMAVHAVMVKTASIRPAAKPDAVKSDGIAKKMTKGRTTGTDVIRVASRELIYSDEARKAEFSGGVEVESGDGDMKAEQLVVYLQPAPANRAGKSNGGKTNATKTGFASPADGSGSIGGKVERMVASGRIEMEQPGRRVTGEELVYTANDDTYVLTGTAILLPKVVDDQRGTVTGSSLRFHPDDDSIVVSNGGEAGTGQRVRTETRVKNKQ